MPTFFSKCKRFINFNFMWIHGNFLYIQNWELIILDIKSKTIKSVQVDSYINDKRDVRYFFSQISRQHYGRLLKMSFPMYGFKDACSTGLKLFGEKCKDSDWPLFIKTTMPPINTSGESWLYPCCHTNTLQRCSTRWKIWQRLQLCRVWSSMFRQHG